MKFDIQKRFTHSYSTGKIKNDLIFGNDLPQKLNRNMSNFTKIERIHGSNKILSIKKNLLNFSGIEKAKTSYNTFINNNKKNGDLIRQNNSISYSNSDMYNNINSNFGKEFKNNNLNYSLINPTIDHKSNKLLQPQNLKFKNQINKNRVLNQNFYINQNNNIFATTNHNNFQNNIIRNNQTTQQILNTISIPKIPQPTKIFSVTKTTSKLQKMFSMSKPMNVPKIQQKSQIFKIIQNANNDKKPQIKNNPQNSEIQSRKQKVKKQDSLQTKSQKIPKKKSPKIVKTINTYQTVNLPQIFNLVNSSEQFPFFQNAQSQEFYISDNNNYFNSMDYLQNNSFSNIINNNNNNIFYTGEINTSAILNNNNKKTNNSEFSRNNTGRQTWSELDWRINNDFFKNFDLYDVYKSTESNQQNFLKPLENTISYNLNTQNNNINKIQKFTNYKNRFVDNSNIGNNTSVFNVFGNNKFRFGDNQIILNKFATKRSSVPPPSKMSFSGKNLSYNTTVGFQI